MEYEPKYTVVLRGQEFILTKSQIEFDSPNYFTACFLGDFHEAQTKRLELSRSPDLFKLIIEHLCGYEILPLDNKANASHMSADSVLRNLRADALFYQLDGLVKSCDRVIKPRKTGRLFMVIGRTSSSTTILSNTDSSSSISVNDLKFQERYLKPGDVWVTTVTEDILSRMGQLQLRRSYADFEGLETVAAIQDFAQKAVGNYSKSGWTLMGWRFEAIPRPDDGSGQPGTKILIVLEGL
ncbi:hypothetical protein RSOLAG22IIIB_06143 [Rhizoctonia solani]|uniref:BTB domain-containing protein n=1 Tax=Rhizoctonia solani TaxID=456999 RepID=A0A0K6GCK6_9AGAM|nr:hypothetical protein RSOLAG22IIIB_06143 [Rhizoctonia solani]